MRMDDLTLNPNKYSFSDDKEVINVIDKFSTLSYLFMPWKLLIIFVTQKITINFLFIWNKTTKGSRLLHSGWNFFGKSHCEVRICTILANFFGNSMLGLFFYKYLDNFNLKVSTNTRFGIWTYLNNLEFDHAKSESPKYEWRHKRMTSNTKSFMSPFRWEGAQDKNNE